MVALSEIELKKDYVLVRIQGGSFRPVDIMATIGKFKKAIKGNTINKILVVRENPVKMITSLFYLYKLAEYLMFQNTPYYRIALVFPHEMHTENLKLFVTASQNKGMRFNLFSDVEEGKNWLFNPETKSQII